VEEDEDVEVTRGGIVGATVEVRPWQEMRKGSYGMVRLNDDHDPIGNLHYR